MNCDECDNQIAGESKQSFMVAGYFCSVGCQDTAERSAV